MPSLWAEQCWPLGWLAVVLRELRPYLGAVMTRPAGGKPHYRLHCLKDHWANYWVCLPHTCPPYAWCVATWYSSSAEAIRRSPR